MFTNEENDPRFDQSDWDHAEDRLILRIGYAAFQTGVLCLAVTLFCIAPCLCTLTAVSVSVLASFHAWINVK
jgi:hypothetical protein